MSRNKILSWLVVVCAALPVVLLAIWGASKLNETANSRDIRQNGNPASSATSSATRIVPTPDPAKGSLPNVLLITIDSLRSDYLGINGNSQVNTPNLDALARQGANFTLDISAFSQTNPSHASLFTGSYPATHNLKLHCVDRIGDAVVTLAELLGRDGYHTNAIYSWPCFEWDFGFDRGFDFFKGVYVKVSEETNIDRSVDGKANLTTDGVLEWASQNPASPYFLWVHYMDPHYPYTPPPPFDTMYDPDCRDCLDGSWESIDKIYASHPSREADIKHVQAAYAGEISFTDEEIGRLLTGLRKAGLMDNTMVIVTSDHGEALSENGYWFHPWIFYSSVLRVPLIISYPPAIPPGTIVGAVVRSVDIMPTILESAQVPVPSQTEGLSLWPLIRGTEGGDVRTAFAESVDDSVLVIMTSEWKMIVNYGSGESMLFRIKDDPGELRDVSTAYPEQAAALENDLKRWAESHGISTTRR